MNLPFDQAMACDLWNSLTTRTVGCDSDGNPIGDETTIGVLAISHGLALFLFPAKQASREDTERRRAEDRRHVADALRRFANAIDGTNETRVEDAPHDPGTPETMDDESPMAATNSDAAKRSPWTCGNCDNKNPADAETCVKCGAGF